MVIRSPKPNQASTFGSGLVGRWFAGLRKKKGSGGALQRVSDFKNGCAAREITCLVPKFWASGGFCLRQLWKSESNMKNRHADGNPILAARKLSLALPEAKLEATRYAFEQHIHLSAGLPLEGVFCVLPTCLDP